MKTYAVTFLQLGVLTGTRAIAAAGLALLCAGKVTPEQRKAIGWSLLGTGTMVYLVLISDLLLRRHAECERGERQA